LVSGVSTVIGTYDTTDYIRIELNSDSVRFYKNEVKIAASKYVSSNYYIIVLFEQASGHFDYISSSFDTPVTETVSINMCATVSSKTPTVASANGATIRGLKLNGADSIRRSLLRFSLDSIPVRAVVVSAYLKVYCTQATGTYASNLKMINAAWTSAVTWNTKPAVLTTNIVPIDTFSVGKWKNINITNVVQKWVNKDNVNYGFELSLKNEALTTVVGKHALSFASEFGIANKPSIVIQYLADAPFAVLDRKTDGGYHLCDNNRLCFVYNEEYFREEDAKLCYYIYNENMVAVAGVDKSGNALTGGSPVPGVQAGSNKYAFQLSDMNLPTGNFYLLEVVNSKNEKYFLRFKN
jgi:hypothetical protein